MAAIVRPSTPIAQSSRAPSTPETGTWKHPRFDEITRRQNASTFSDRNLKTILYNTGGLFASWLLGQSRANPPTYLLTLIRIVFIFNILVALRPVFYRKDDLSDIPLTPAQRRLLGVPPSNTPPAPGSQYITPPRYPSSANSQSGSPSGAYSPSPLSGKGSPSHGTPTGSPFSPNASPFLSKAVGGLTGVKYPSYGSPSPLGPGTSKGNWLGSPSTPSPSTGKGPSVTLNNKWLWEKGRRRSGDTRVFS